MATTLKSDITQAIAQSFIDDVFLQKSRYYYTVGRSQQWVDDFNPDQVKDTERYERDSRKDILYAKQIAGTSLSFVVPRYNYQKNVTYDKYDDSVNMSGKRYYVLNSDFNVYKCLDNTGLPSQIEPYGTSPDTLVFSDGYKWQYICTIFPSVRSKFLTDEYMPVFNTITERYYSRGAISSVKINSGGFGYTETTTEIVVSGDGYLADNPVKINDFFIGANGAGYSTVPSAETEDQFGNFTTYTGSTSLIKGQRIKVTDVSGIRFYEAITSGVISNITPTHYYTTETNGTVQLKHVGTKPKITSTIDETAVGLVKIIDGGFGYTSIPEITKTSPGSGCTLSATLNGTSITKITVNTFGTGYSDTSIEISSPFPTALAFPTTTAVAAGDIFYSTVSGKTYFYRVDVAGTTSNTAPTHTTGTATNGTAVITVVGKQAEAEAVLGIVDSVIKYFDVSKIKILNQGTGYNQSTTSIVFTGGNPEIPAIASAVVSGGKITSINLTYPGYGYQSAPTVTITGDGTSATASVEMQCGYGYSLAPAVLFSEPDNPEGTPPVVFSTVTKTEASLKPVIIDGILRGVEVEDGGTGYTLANLTVIGNGQGASLTPVFASSELNTIQAQSELLATAGTISSITVDEQGENITSLSIQLVGDGNGVQLAPVVDNGKLVRVEVLNPGSDYTTLNIAFTVNSNATPPIARAIIAPQGGHGSNPIKELGAKSIALNVAIGNEINNGFVFNNQFRQITIIKAPLSYNQEKLFEDMTGSSCFVILSNLNSIPLAQNILLSGENNSLYRVIDFTNDKALISILGNNPPEIGSILSFEVSGINYNIQVDDIEPPDFDKTTGQILYINNREPFSPSENQTLNITTIINLE